ncbi:hypothetical protein GCM10022226_48760 [Sphaerisporangium flaviroseum]|uniref:Uncharacterized protein n=1 Tax=Sphaerisporangium flaviroseum TaxID=509199 RepID=A0ABP7INH9_9ACTN
MNAQLEGVVVTVEAAQSRLQPRPDGLARSLPCGGCVMEWRGHDRAAWHNPALDRAALYPPVDNSGDTAVVAWTHVSHGTYVSTVPGEHWANAD